MPKIVDFALPPGGTIVDVAPSNATALDIESAGADYITVDTTGSGSVIIGKLLTLEAGMTFSGATTFTIPANEENAFLVEDDSGNDYLQIDTRTGAEILRLSSDGLAGIEVHINNSGGANNAEVRFADEIGFIADPDCMIRRSNSNEIEFRFVSTDVFKINVDGAFVETGKLGVGITSSLDADKLHVYTGDIGLSNFNAAAKAIIVESDEHQGMTFAAPAAKEQAIYFINSTANDRYGLVMQGNLDRMFIRSNDSYALNLQQNKVGIANTLASLTHQLQTQDGDIGIVKNSADAVGSKLIFEKSRNATDGSHTVVSDNDILGTVEFRGSDTNTFEAGASIFARVQGTPSDGSMPTELAFAVTPSGSTTPAEAINIRSNGHVGIGDTFPNYRLHVNQNGSQSTSVFYNTSTTGKGAGPSGSMAAYFENKVGPTITLNNAVHEDSDGGRETGIHFCGEKANAGEQHWLVSIVASHDGTGDDQKGKFTISVNDGDDDHAPSLTPFQIDSNGRTAIGTSPGTVGEVLRVRQNHTSDTLSLFENTGAGVALEAQTNSTSNSVDILRTKNSSGITFGARADGAVFVGASSLNGHDFEVNNGTQAVTIDIQGTTSSISVLGHDNNTIGRVSLGGPQGYSILASKYGAANVTSQLGEVATWLDNQTNANRSAYLADSNTDLVLDWDVGQVGIIELVDNIDKIKFYNCPQVGRVRSFTLRIKQHASSAKTVSYSTIEFYTNKGSSAVSGTKTLQWSGGAAHVMSTGVGDIDIVQFTAFSDSSNTVQIYGSVIGQNFS